MGAPITLKELLDLREASLQIRELAAVLVDFEDKHIFAQTMKQSLDACITELNKIHHNLDRDIYKMRKVNNLGE